MLSVIRGLLLILGVALPILKAVGAPFLASTSWLLVFAPLMIWGILFLIALSAILGVAGAALVAAVKR